VFVVFAVLLYNCLVLEVCIKSDNYFNVNTCGFDYAIQQNRRVLLFFVLNIVYTVIVLLKHY